MVCWPLIAKTEYFGQLDKMVPLGIAMGIMLTFVRYFDNLLSQIRAGSQELKNLAIGDAFREILAKGGGRVRRIRIYALTTEVILPVVRDVNCKIEVCEILLHKFDENGHVHAARQLNKTVSDIKDKWGALKIQGQIQKLKIVLYTDMPSQYVVIFDDKAVMQGLFVPNDASPHGCDLVEPVIIWNNDETAGKLVEKYTKWFDVMYEYWEHA